MFHSRRRSAFTLIELLVVVAIIALLISILLPSLQGAREQGKRAACLTNMRSIAQASNGYATEDKREHLIPIHQNAVSAEMGDGFAGEWSWRTAVPFSYGGQTPTQGFPQTGGAITNTMRKPTTRWGADSRPLNRYVYGSMSKVDTTGMAIYRCPSDAGFFDDPNLQDAPPEAAGLPCYEIVGNSYRYNVAGVLWPAGAVSQGFFSVAAWGHRLSSLVDTGRLVAYCEPMFYNFSRQEAGGFDPDQIKTRGWHKAVMTDNVSYVDGSGRSTRVNRLSAWDATTLSQMKVSTAGGAPTWYWLRHGETWRTTCYPTVGAFVRVKNAAGTAFLMDKPPATFLGSGWPFDGYQDNILME